jgi:hypothetical protein
VAQAQRLRQEDGECEVSLGYIVRLCLKEMEKEEEGGGGGGEEVVLYNDIIVDIEH